MHRSCWRVGSRAGASAAVDALEPRRLLSSWYVATGGSDGGPGTLGSPFKTIQHAAGVARPGDTVFVLGGTYRETVAPVRSGIASAPITFKPYNGERVTVSGADVVSGWSKYNGSIYKAPQPWDLGEGNNQVFVDGRMMNEARWPNTGLDVSHPSLAEADSIAANAAGLESVATLRDSALTQSAGAWNGAVIHIASGEQWVAQTGRVTASAPGRIDFAYHQRTGLKAERMETPTGGNPYYLTGKFVALDAPGEWFRKPDGTLYLRTPGSDNPSSHAVEVKRRQYAFDLSGRSYVNVEGFNVFAATIVTDDNSSHVRIDRINARYLSQFLLNDVGWTLPKDTGIRLSGTDNVLANSTLAYSAGDGVFVSGARNRVENNVIHDVAYSGMNGKGVHATGYDQLVVHNTIYNTGRIGILFAGLHRGRVLYNLVHDVGLQTTDLGALYTWGSDGEGTEVAYNVVYNVHSGGFGSAGIYLDNGTPNHVVHHNVVWGADYGLKLNDPSWNNRVYNNTFAASRYAVASGGKRDMAGSNFRNNVFTRPTQIGPTATQSNNVTSGTDPRFVDASAHDYRLRSGSPAIDRGTVLRPYTDGWLGSKPDAGAFEYGAAPWTAGASQSPWGRDVTPPPAPAGLVATASAAGVRLDWFDGTSFDRSAYEVYAAPSRGGPFTRINPDLLRASEYLDRSAPQGAARYYRVVVRDTSDNVSAPSATVVATRPRDVAPPASAPTGLTAVAASGTEVGLAWAPLPDAASYRVERMGPGDSSFVEVARGVIPAAYRATGLRPGATYQFRVRGENSRGVSTHGTTVRVATPAVPTAPARPTVRRVPSTRIDVSFVPVVGATMYSVERRRSGSSTWVKIRTLAPDGASFSDLNTPSGVRYAYRVQAIGPGGVSAYSASATST